MIKTITNLKIERWRDLETNETGALSLFIEYIDEHGASMKTGKLTQDGELDVNVRETPWEDILGIWRYNRPSWSKYFDNEEDWLLLTQYLAGLDADQRDELKFAQNMEYEPVVVRNLLRKVREQLSETGYDTFAYCLKYNIPLDQVRKEYENLAQLRKKD